MSMTGRSIRNPASVGTPAAHLPEPGTIGNQRLNRPQRRFSWRFVLLAILLAAVGCSETTIGGSSEAEVRECMGDNFARMVEAQREADRLVVAAERDLKREATDAALEKLRQAREQLDERPDICE